MLAKAALTQDAGDGWTESLSYANRPLDEPAVAPVLATSAPVAFRTIEFDVTPLVQATLAKDPAKKLGLRLFTNIFASFESPIRISTRYASGDTRPRLIIETTDAPAIAIASPKANPSCLRRLQAAGSAARSTSSGPVSA